MTTRTFCRLLGLARGRCSRDKSPRVLRADDNLLRLAWVVCLFFPCRLPCWLCSSHETQSVDYKRRSLSSGLQKSSSEAIRSMRGKK